MSKLREIFCRLNFNPGEAGLEAELDAAITEAEETIARLTRERDEALARVKVMDDALGTALEWMNARPVPMGVFNEIRAARAALKGDKP